MSARDSLVSIARGGPGREPAPDGLPGSVRRRGEVRPPLAYAVVDCETTGTDPGADEIVSLAVLRLDADGVETARFVSLVRPSCPIPAEATAVHGIGDEDVAQAPRFAEIAPEVLDLLDGAVFVAHNAAFDLGMLQHAFARAGVDYLPAGTACTLDAFRLLEPREASHRLASICARRGIDLAGAHEALGDVVATAALLRVLLDEGIAPETVQLDHLAYMRRRARGDTRPASEPQIRRVFGLARSAGLLAPDGSVDRDRVVALVARIAGTADVDALTREQVQDVYDELELLIAQRAGRAQAATA
jgi:DNA polymerase III epsilon subunit family exonuclease